MITNEKIDKLIRKIYDMEPTESLRKQLIKNLKGSSLSFSVEEMRNVRKEYHQESSWNKLL